MSPARILVVDADIDLRDEVRDALAGRGFDVRAAGPGEAVGDFQPDLVVIDLRDGLLGSALATELGIGLDSDAQRGQLQVHDIVIDPRAHSVTRAGATIDLTATELAVLTALARRAGQVTSKSDLLAQLWESSEVTGNVVEVHVSSLRRKLERHGPRIIQTVRGVGYRI